MDFELTEEQKQIKALVRDLCKREVDQKQMLNIIRKNDAAKTIEEIRANFPHDLEEKAHNAELLTIGIPTRYGGPGPDTDPNMAITIAKEEAGYSGGLAAWFLVGPDFTVQAMRVNPYFTDEQREQRFAKALEYCRVKTTVSHSITDPGGPGGSGGVDIHLPYDEGGSQILQVTARKDGDEWVINGDKMFSSDAGVADLFHVGTRTDKTGDPGTAWTFFWVKKDTPGVTMKINKMVTVSASGNVQTHYENVRVPEIQMMGQPNYGGEKGYSIGETVYETKWMHVPMFLGGMQRMYEQMVEYAKERVVGGRAMIEHSNIAALLGEAIIDLEALRSLIYRTAILTDRRQEQGGPINGFWNLAVWNFFKRKAWRFCQIGSEVYGGIASSVDLPLEGFTRFVYMVLPAGSTPSMEATKASMEYNKHPIASQFGPK